MPPAMALLVADPAAPGPPSSDKSASDSQQSDAKQPDAKQPDPPASDHRPPEKTPVDKRPAEKRPAPPAAPDAKQPEKRARRRDASLTRVTAPTAFDEVRWELRPRAGCGAARLRLPALRTSGKLPAEVAAKFVRSKLSLPQERIVELYCAGVLLRPEMTLETLVRKVWPADQGHLVLEYAVGEEPPEEKEEEKGEAKEEEGNDGADDAQTEGPAAGKGAEPPGEEVAALQ